MTDMQGSAGQVACRNGSGVERGVRQQGPKWTVELMLGRPRWLWITAFFDKNFI